MTGERFTPALAREIGLVHVVVPPAELDVTVESTIQELLTGAPRAMRACKALARDVAHMEQSEARTITTETIARLRVSAEGQEGLRAYSGEAQTSMGSSGRGKVENWSCLKKFLSPTAVRSRCALWQLAARWASRLWLCIPRLTEALATYAKLTKPTRSDQHRRRRAIYAARRLSRWHGRAARRRFIQATAFSRKIQPLSRRARLRALSLSVRPPPRCA